MYEVPLDAWYVWLGVAVASGATFSLAGAMPAAAPPDAEGAADTVDGVAASNYDSVGRHPLPATERVRVGRDSLSLSGPGGVTHAGFAYGPVTPGHGDERLAAVVAGEPPDRVFEDAAEFERATEAARARDPEWREADGLLVRRISWEDVDVVLVD